MIIVWKLVWKSIALREEASKQRNNALLLENKERYLLDKEDKINQREYMVDEIIATASQDFAWLAYTYADYEYIKYDELAEYIRNKKRPAIKASEELKAIATNRREIQIHCKMLEYQLNFYESLFPWLEDFKEIPPKEATLLLSPEYASEDNILKNWLSPEEYAKLSDIEKNQLALERYRNRKKSNWEVGIDFERYIGFLYEKENFHVSYQGAIMGLEDMGRDLIAERDEEILVIQCKRWAKSKIIHEKHIFQLYGTTVLMQIQNPYRKVSGVFVTTASLSELAEKCAAFLKIKVEIIDTIYNYPQIKCNISKKNKEKIYHLPFDQQYDKVVIIPNSDEFYAYTVEEAELKGFRHAKKWLGE